MRKFFTERSNHLKNVHEAILERLDWTQNKDGFTHYYPVSEFEKALSTFENIPVIYAARHPPLGVRGKNLDEVLKEVGGTLAGYTQDVKINQAGSPKLKALLHISNEDVEAKILAGKISISPSFSHNQILNGSLENITGDHVLLYDSDLGIPQGDATAIICNQDSTDFSLNHGIGYFEGVNMTGEIKTIDMDLYNDLLSLKNNQAVIVDNEKTILKLNQDLEKKDESILKLNQDLTAEKETVLKLNQALEETKKQVSALENKIKEEAEKTFKQNQDSFWVDLPAGIQDQFKERKEELYSVGTALKLNQDINRALLKMEKPDLHEAAGKQDTKNNQDEPSYESLNAEFQAATGVI